MSALRRRRVRWRRGVGFRRTCRQRGRARSLRRGPVSEVYDGAGQRAGDALDALDLRHDQLAELVDVLRLGAHDHVVRARDVLGLRDTADVGDGLRDGGRLPDLGLDEDVGLDRHDVGPLLEGWLAWRTLPHGMWASSG